MDDTSPAAPAAGRRPGNLPVAVPFIEALGVELLEMAAGRAVATMTPGPTHTNSWGVVHGGVLMTLLDFAMAMAGRSARTDLDREGSSAAGNLTVEMKTTFLRPGSGRLTAVGTTVLSGRSLTFCEAMITNEAGDRVATATGTFKYWSGR